VSSVWQWIADLWAILRGFWGFVRGLWSGGVDSLQAQIDLMPQRVMNLLPQAAVDALNTVPWSEIAHLWKALAFLLPIAWIVNTIVATVSLIMLIHVLKLAARVAMKLSPVGFIKRVVLGG
jgi:hypothetical protein